MKIKFGLSKMIERFRRISYTVCVCVKFVGYNHTASRRRHVFMRNLYVDLYLLYANADYCNIDYGIGSLGLGIRTLLSECNEEQEFLANLVFPNVSGAGCGCVRMKSFHCNTSFFIKRLSFHLIVHRFHLCLCTTNKAPSYRLATR